MKFLKSIISLILLIIVLVVGILYINEYKIYKFNDNVIKSDEYYFKYTNIFTDYDTISSVIAYKKVGIFYKDVSHDNYDILTLDDEVIGYLYTYQGNSKYYNFIIGDIVLNSNKLVFTFNELKIDNNTIDVYKNSYFISNEKLESIYLDDVLVNINTK